MKIEKENRVFEAVFSSEVGEDSEIIFAKSLEEAKVFAESRGKIIKEVNELTIKKGVYNVRSSSISTSNRNEFDFSS
jgi:hypothetical protein